MGPVGIVCKKDTVVYETNIGSYGTSAFMKDKLSQAASHSQMDLDAGLSSFSGSSSHQLAGLNCVPQNTDAEDLHSRTLEDECDCKQFHRCS